MELMIALLCLFIVRIEAQDPTNHGQEINPLRPSIAVVLVVLSMMFFFTFLIVAYAKFCHRPQPHNINDPQIPGGILRSRSRFSGIDRNLIESLPFFRFSSLKGSKEGLECAVCLSRFEETEVLRLLPRCRHAFHMSCIDTWLENHSSCPLCRYKFDAGDLKSLSKTNSFRSSADEPNLEFFIRREQNQERPSSRFNILGRGKRDEPLIDQEFKNVSSGKIQILHNLKHKIIVSDVMYKSRWSDVNSSDMISLNSEMLSAVSGKRFSSISGRFTDELSAKEQILKIKEDMGRKRFVESKVVGTGNGSGETSGSCPDDHRIDIELDESMKLKPLDPAEKRSMSEITNFSRFKPLNESSRMMMMSRLSTSVDTEKDNIDNVRRVWLPIARRTIQWFGDQETSNSISDPRKHVVNV